MNEKPSNSGLKVKKQPKRGIIYLSSIPPYMNVTLIKEYFSRFGDVGRIYLQLAETETKKNGKKSKRKNAAYKYTEGWIEFKRKSIAKEIVQLLNNTQVDTRKKSKQYDSIWNLKYLSGFKWPHLHERLAYEKAARRQKLRLEIEMAKKKTNFFNANVGKKKKDVVNKELENITEIQEDVESEESQTGEREQFLKSLFTE